MNALLLAAGFGTRLRPITLKTPKCLVEVGGIPLLDHWLGNLAGASVKDVRINTHYLADVVESHISRTSFNGRIECAHESELLGTAGTLLKHADLCDKDGLLIIHADNYCGHQLKNLAAAHAARPPGCSITTLAFRTDQPSACGIFETNELGIATGFHEKVANPPGNLANCAVAIFDAAAIARIKSEFSNAFDIASEVLPSFIGEMFVVETTDYFADIGTPEMLQRTNEFLSSTNAT